MVKISLSPLKAQLQNLLFCSASYAWFLTLQRGAVPTAIPSAITGDTIRGQSIKLSELMKTTQSARSANVSFH